MAKATTATVRPTCHFGPATGQLCRRILKRGIHTLSRMRKVRSRISQTKKRDVEMSKTVPCQIGSYWRIGWGTYQENDSSVKGGVGMLIQIQFLSATHWTSHFAFAFNVDKEAL